MENEIIVLLVTAISAGFLHTVLGPDHYLPFIALAKAHNWSRRKTLFITLGCGFGHVMSSVILAVIGVAISAEVMKIEAFESMRGDIAAWLFLIFGFTYMIWGVFHALKHKEHAHSHTHADGTTHSHAHAHETAHTHAHEKKGISATTVWMLFIIFIFGPCEPMIPIIMYPAIKGNITEAVTVAVAFSTVTLITMTVIVMGSVFGLSKINLRGAERYAHAAAGFVVFMSGVGIKFLGL